MLKRISEAREVLQKKWSNEGACGSCGWHALLYEHNVSDFEIAEALDGGGTLKLRCHNKDDDSRSTHRGVKIHHCLPR